MTALLFLVWTGHYVIWDFMTFRFFLILSNDISLNIKQWIHGGRMNLLEQVSSKFWFNLFFSLFNTLATLK